jgi:hypothetical protein
MFTAWNITTYGVSALISYFESTSLCSLEDDIGARCAVYDDGIDIPSAERVYVSRNATKIEEAYVSRTA